MQVEYMVRKVPPGGMVATEVETALNDYARAGWHIAPAQPFDAMILLERYAEDAEVG